MLCFHLIPNAITRSTARKIEIHDSQNYLLACSNRILPFNFNFLIFSAIIATPISLQNTLYSTYFNSLTTNDFSFFTSRTSMSPFFVSLIPIGRLRTTTRIFGVSFEFCCIINGALLYEVGDGPVTVGAALPYLPLYTLGL